MKINGNTVGTTMPRANYNQTDPKKADYLVGRENIVGKNELASLTDKILAEAKESGEFDGKDGINGRDGVDGKDGIDGKDGQDGKDGYTPIKGVDYFDGKDGEDGKDGINGRDGVDGKDGKDFEKIILTCANTTAGSSVTYPADMTVDALKEAIINGSALVSIANLYDTTTFLLTSCTDYREMTSSMNYIMAKGSYVPPTSNNPAVLFFYIYFDTTTGAVTSISLSSNTTLTHPSVYITSEYTSGIWRVRKWSNNVVELWGRYTATVNISTLWKNNIYYAPNSIPQQTFPVTFTAVPKILATANCVDDAYFLVTGSGSVVPTTTKTGQLQVACPLSRTGVGIDISFYVHGTIA